MNLIEYILSWNVGYSSSFSDFIKYSTCFRIGSILISEREDEGTSFRLCKM